MCHPICAYLDARVLGDRVELLLAQYVLGRLVRVEDAHLVRVRVRVGVRIRVRARVRVGVLGLGSGFA